MALKLKKEYAGVVYSPRREEIYDNGGGVLYPRPVELHHAGERNGLVLAVFDHYTLKEPPVFPIYASRDHGRTWAYYSQVDDTKNGHGMRFQPMLLELDRDVADLPAGTLLLTGNSIPLSFETTPQGGENGTIIVSGKRDSGELGLRDPGDFLVNYHLGEGPWERVPMLVSYDARIHQAGWSMGMCAVEDGKRLLQLAPTQCDPVLLQISYGIGNLETL